MHHPLTLLTLPFVALAAAGCGGDSEGPGSAGGESAKQQIEAVVRDYERALGNRDAQAICGQLAPSQFTGGFDRTRCAAVLTETSPGPGQEAPRFDIAKIDVRGDSAKVYLTEDSSAAWLELERTNGRWYLLLLR